MLLSVKERLLISRALRCHANWIETGNPVLSAGDVAYQLQKHKPRILDQGQIDSIRTMRDLADKVQSDAAPQYDGNQEEIF